MEGQLPLINGTRQFRVNLVPSVFTKHVALLLHSVNTSCPIAIPNSVIRLGAEQLTTCFLSKSTLVGSKATTFASTQGMYS